ncbi:MAG: adenine deaminase [Dehalococcoidia bacterium]|nr:adenine deaminase [Dehalococcoidia bacterium]
MSLAEAIAVARGDAPGDLLLANARVVNVFTAEIEAADVLLFAGRVAAIGAGYQARRTVDLRGRFLLPAFINGHTHIESSHLWVTEYARAVVPHGTAAVVTDLHEIANVAGLPAIEAAVRAAARTPLALYLMAPSCVPASPLETAGASFGPDEIRQALRLPRALGLGELMDFPGVISTDPDVLSRVEAAGGRLIDGHAPGLSGNALNAYLVAGPRSDHESIRLEEAREKLRRGMYVMIREGTTEKNLRELLPLVTDRTASRCLLVVDDRSPADLLEDGDIDGVVRRAVALGLDPIRAVQLVTINAAACFQLTGVGAIAPGYRADLIVADDLQPLNVAQVYVNGELVAENGAALFSTPAEIDPLLTRSVNMRPLTRDSFALPAAGPRYPVIEIVPGQIFTARRMEDARVEGGRIVPDIERDILKLAVVERHHASGRVGVGLVKGFGLKRGAIASSYAHDSHNIIVAGTNDDDMLEAVRRIESMQGGLTVIADGRNLADVPLPVLGLMSADPVEMVAAALAAANAAAASLGALLDDPFAALSFLALPVIPSLKLTDRGLVDVDRGALFDFGG